jgi:FixJ family two-component response regulator
VVHVIDDDPSWRTSVQRLLSALGYGVALYEAAEQFLEASEGKAPGYVLLDMRMPELSGLQLRQRLVAMRRRVPVIFVSGHGDHPDQRARHEVGRRAQLESLHDRLRPLILWGAN